MFSLLRIREPSAIATLWPAPNRFAYAKNLIWQLLAIAA
jgi:hypothetical protein